jgi:hypothetical protein
METSVKELNMELNPNHPVTQAVSDHWHTICAILMNKMGTDHLIITQRDIQRMTPGSCIVIHEKKDGIHLKMVSREEGERMAREQGGLPT